MINCFHLFKLIGEPLVSFVMANNYPTKPFTLCCPSQYGLFAEWPQRQRNDLASFVSAVPSAFKTLIVPSTISGPLANTVTFTFDSIGVFVFLLLF